MSEDVDVNDDGVPDQIVPTKVCWPAGLSPVRKHGPHTHTDYAVPPRVWRCPGFPLPITWPLKENA